MLEELSSLGGNEVSLGVGRQQQDEGWVIFCDGFVRTNAANRRI